MVSQERQSLHIYTFEDVTFELRIVLQSMYINLRINFPSYLFFLFVLKLRLGEQ